jgi:hypothetical protein
MDSKGVYYSILVIDFKISYTVKWYFLIKSIPSSSACREVIDLDLLKLYKR